MTKMSAARKKEILDERRAESTRNTARWATFLISGGGFALAWYLNEMHLQASLGQTVGGALCDAHRVMDCESAASSHFSEIFGIPIALLGLCFYAGAMALVLFDRQAVRVSDAPFRPAALTTTLFALSLGYSLFLGGVSLFVLQTLCPFCVMLYVVNGIGLAAAAMWAGGSPWRVIQGQLKSPVGVANGWTALFVGTFGFFLLVGMQVSDVAERDRRIRTAERPSLVEQQALDPAVVHRPGAPAMGPDDAPVQIVKFSNFPCPHCAVLADVLHRVKEEYPEEVRVEYRYFPLPHQEHGMTAATAAFCAGEQGEFWRMHDLLFAGAPAHDRDSVARYAEQLDLDEEVFSRCLDSSEAKQWVDSDVAAGRRLGVEATPSFFINGYPLAGALPVEMMRELINEVLKGQSEP